MDVCARAWVFAKSQNAPHLWAIIIGMKRIVMFVATGLLLAACQPGEQAAPKEKDGQKQPAYNFYPAQKGEVNDFENILSSIEEKMLTERILLMEDSAAVDVVIATVDSIPHDMDIVLYATELGNRWNIGSENKKNGLVIVLSYGNQQVGIATGKGLEDRFNDEETGRVINQEMLPQFSVGEPFRGLMKGINALLAVQPEEAPSGLEN